VKAYVDTSVLLRIVLEEPNPLPEWSEIAIGLTSALLRVECCRALDRLVRDGNIADEQYAARLAEVDEMLAQMLVLPITPLVLRIASRRFGMRVDTLDAIHLSTAEEYRAAHLTDDTPVFATHDRTLAAAARHVGFKVIGSPLESPA
jgi:predicted nucleic acid-binding protein